MNTDNLSMADRNDKTALLIVIKGEGKGCAVYRCAWCPMRKIERFAQHTLRLLYHDAYYRLRYIYARNMFIRKFGKKELLKCLL